MFILGAIHGAPFFVSAFSIDQQVITCAEADYEDQS
jgi:hypothetical protein